MSPREDTPACPDFEATLLLMDGLLDADARAQAATHVRACGVCGPLVTGWDGIHVRLVGTFEEAAELAKPALAELPRRVEQVLHAQRAARTIRRQRIIRYPAFALGLAGLAAVVLVRPAAPPRGTPRATVAPIQGPRGPAVAMAQLPVAQAPATEVPEAPAAPAGPDETAMNEPPAAAASPNDCHMHTLSFDDADGVVYRTETDGVTVIWVNEHDGA